MPQDASRKTTLKVVTEVVWRPTRVAQLDTSSDEICDDIFDVFLRIPNAFLVVKSRERSVASDRGLSLQRGALHEATGLFQMPVLGGDASAFAFFPYNNGGVDLTGETRFKCLMMIICNCEGCLS